ncbi:MULTISPECIES: translation initiation factor [Reichenbachiella]|uniref:Translation initiation factor 1 n=1 Tax=Reichenbachiella agariperforans TaxID=156994 RepID=A0A1M6M804_REIAG|nr:MULTISPECIES: translation initiation factor [Reichenbachiella]MBU2914462.1 translation initiation factor [Reichenbachiella agariperforans]RJE73883.1 translation initiation factor SUI1 [Reichenbachiella sp. MSK19-1]SHJ79585.1 translation initiation factor 1 [Reichenbachiella agariperforans]
MAKKNNFKNRIGVVYSTEDSFDYTENEELEEETLAKQDQQLRVLLDKKNRGGKQVTLVTGFVGMTGDLKELGKLVKSKCGVGGNVKDREIIIQGDLRDKVVQILEKEGYKARKI